jgi:hypothetical protein
MSVTAASDSPGMLRLADVARLIKRVGTQDLEPRLRIVWEFLRSAQDDGFPLRNLVEQEPEQTGDPRFDAMLAAVAEDLCVHADEAPPDWVHESHRFLARAWWVSNLPSARAAALVHTPASYRRRGVMVERRDLISV